MSEPVVNVKRVVRFADVLTGRPRQVYVIDCPQCGKEHEVISPERGKCHQEPWTEFRVVLDESSLCQ